MASNLRTTIRQLENLAIDFDLANSKALFKEIDPDDAAPDSPGGRRVPEAVGLVIAVRRDSAQFQRFLGEFAPALLWSARFDFRRTVSLTGYGVG